MGPYFLDTQYHAIMCETETHPLIRGNLCMTFHSTRFAYVCVHKFANQISKVLLVFASLVCDPQILEARACKGHGLIQAGQ